MVVVSASEVVLVDVIVVVVFLAAVVVVNVVEDSVVVVVAVVILGVVVIVVVIVGVKVTGSEMQSAGCFKLLLTHFNIPYGLFGVILCGFQESIDPSLHLLASKSLNLEKSMGNVFLVPFQTPSAVMTPSTANAEFSKED